MRLVLQRVDSAKVSVDGEIVGEIGKGLLILLGVSKTDTETTVGRAIDKIARLRIFADDNGKTNLSSKDVKGGVLVVSQFTLQADLSSNRPSFSGAAPKELAESLYESFVDKCRLNFCSVGTGKFGAHMHISAENDGPFTLVLEL